MELGQIPVFLILSMVNVALPSLMIYAWWSTKKFPGLAYWMYGSLCISIGTILLMVYCLTSVRIISAAGVFLELIGLELLLIGCQVYLGRKPRRFLAGIYAFTGSTLIAVFSHLIPKSLELMDFFFTPIFVRAIIIFMKKSTLKGYRSLVPATASTSLLLFSLYIGIADIPGQTLLPIIPAGLRFALFTLLYGFLIMTLVQQRSIRLYNELNVRAEEKTLLLREMHHRTKNNLAVVAGMIRLDAGRVQDPEAAEILSALEKKIHTIMFLHRELQEENTADRVRVDRYIDSVLEAALPWTEETGERIRVERNIEPLEVSVASAIPLGLIVNELVINAGKHAFPRNRRGTIVIAMRRAGDSMELAVSDDGVGFTGDLRPDSLGLSLVESLAAQLEGTFSIDGSAGTRAVLRLPCEDTEGPPEEAGISP